MIRTRHPHYGWVMVVPKTGPQRGAFKWAKTLVLIPPSRVSPHGLGARSHVGSLFTHADWHICFSHLIPLADEVGALLKKGGRWILPA